MDQFTNHSYPYTASPQPFESHPFQPHPQRSFSTGSISLQVSTTNGHGQEIDPLEYTARPSNINPSPFNMEPTPTQRHPSFPLPLGGDIGLSQLNVGQSSEGSSSGAISAPNSESSHTLPSNSISRSTSFKLTPLTRPLNQQEQERLAQLDRLKFFLATAPSRWDDLDPNDPSTSDSADPGSHSHLDPANPHPALNRFLLPSNEYVSCVLWSGLYHITGTDIVRALVFR
jgi:transcription factor STE12